MKEAEWEDGQVKGGPQDMLETLIRSGYPWNILGSRLKEIDQQFKSVTEEYAEIDDSLKVLTRQVNAIGEKQSDAQNTVRAVLRDEAGSLQNRWLIAAASMVAALVGLGLTLSSNLSVSQFLKSNGMFVGLGIIALVALAFYLNSRRK
jgi:hypothetical protein